MWRCDEVAPMVRELIAEGTALGRRASPEAVLAGAIDAAVSSG